MEEPGRSELQAAVEWHGQELAQFEQQVANVQLTIKRMINSTDLAEKMLGASYEYRLYSGLSHGNPTAVNALRAMFDSTHPDSVGIAWLYFLQAPVDAYFRAVWAFAEHMVSPPPEPLRQEIESLYGELHFADEMKSYLAH